MLSAGWSALIYMPIGLLAVTLPTRCRANAMTYAECTGAIDDISSAITRPRRLIGAHGQTRHYEFATTRARSAGHRRLFSTYARDGRRQLPAPSPAFADVIIFAVMMRRRRRPRPRSARNKAKKKPAERHEIPRAQVTPPAARLYRRAEIARTFAIMHRRHAAMPVQRLSLERLLFDFQ